MKSFELKVFKEDIQGKETFLSTFFLLKNAINVTTQQGISAEEMAKRVRLLDKIDEHKALFDIDSNDVNDSMLEKKAVLQLEDADYQKLKELFNEMKWNIVSKSIIEIHKELNK